MVLTSPDEITKAQIKLLGLGGNDSNLNVFFRVTKMCFDIGIVTCGPNEALVVSGMGYGEINPDTKEYRPFVVMGRQLLIPQTKIWLVLNLTLVSVKHTFIITSSIFDTGGGRAIVCPCLQTIQRITLNTMTLEVLII